MTERITPEIIAGIVALIPDSWLAAGSPTKISLFGSPAEYRNAYIEYLTRRIEPPHVFLEEAIRARSLSI